MTFVELSDAFRQGVHDDDTCADLLGRVDDAAERVCEQDPAPRRAMREWPRRGNRATGLSPGGYTNSGGCTPNCR